VDVHRGARLDPLRGDRIRAALLLRLTGMDAEIETAEERERLLKDLPPQDRKRVG
jgi:hypothetical protein